MAITNLSAVSTLLRKDCTLHVATKNSMTLLFGNRTQVVELLVKCFTAQLCSRDKKHMLLARHHPIS